MADRYTYFPLVGVFIAVAFGIRYLANRVQFPKAAVASAAALTLAGCLVLTENQLRCWRDSESLFAHTLAATGEDNPSAHINYGVALEQKDRLAEALVQYREAARMAPDSIEAHYNTGNLLDKMGQPGLVFSFIARACIYNKAAMRYGRWRMFKKYPDAVG